ncbi:MAG: hypothetical protein WCK67_05155 [bacterium]
MKANKLISLIIVLTFICMHSAIADALPTKKIENLNNNNSINKVINSKITNNTASETKTNVSEAGSLPSGGAADVDNTKQTNQANIIQKFSNKYLSAFKVKFSIMNILKSISAIVLVCGIIFWLLKVFFWLLKKGTKSTPIGLANAGATGKDTEQDYINYSVSSFVKHRIKKKL